MTRLHNSQRERERDREREKRERNILFTVSRLIWNYFALYPNVIVWIVPSLWKLHLFWMDGKFDHNSLSLYIYFRAEKWPSDVLYTVYVHTLEDTKSA